MKCGNLIGRAVKVDKQSAEASRGQYARVCVEVNLNEPLIPFIWVCEKLKAVEYEGRISDVVYPLLNRKGLGRSEHLGMDPTRLEYMGEG